MRQIRSLLALVVPILVLLFLSLQVYAWHFNYTEFRSDLAVASVMTGLALLVVLSVTAPNRGLPTSLRRDMMEEEYGRVPVQSGAAGGKAHRTFTSSVGGHVARFAGILQQLIERGVGVSPRLTLLRVGA